MTSNFYCQRNNGTNTVHGALGQFDRATIRPCAGLDFRPHARVFNDGDEVMTRVRMFFVILATLLGTAGSAAAQVAPTDTGCPVPGQGRGARPASIEGQAQSTPSAGQAATQGAAGDQRRPSGYEAGGPPKKRLLIWADTRNGIAQHDIGHAMAVIEELGYKSGLYDTYIRTDSNIISRRPKMTTGDPASGGPSLCNVDAIFFLGHREIDLDAQGRADLLWFVHDAGKGFVAVHTAAGAFMSWPEFGEMIGGRYDEHPWGIADEQVIVVDPNFPGMKQFGAVFNFKDEFYQIKDFSVDKSRVLLRLDPNKLDMTKRGAQMNDYPFPLVYAKMYGQGRVFYSSLGHAPATWDDPRIQEMYLGAIKWALGLIDADVTPIPLPSLTAPSAK